MSTPADEAALAAPAPSAEPPVVQQGMFGVTGSGDTSGFGGLVRRARPVLPTPPPWGGWYDAGVAALQAAYPSLGDGLEAVVVDRGELTLHLRREHLLPVLRALRDDPALRFEVLAMVSAADYPDDTTGRRLHVVHHLLSMTHNRRLRLETAVTVDDPHVPSAVPVYPTADWHERETWDLLGVVFDGHPGLTRIMMPDDWEGHPQRKDHPLGGIPVEYPDGSVPPPDQRREYA